MSFPELPDDPDKWVSGRAYRVGEEPFASKLQSAADKCRESARKLEALADAFSVASFVANGAPVDDISGSTPRERAIDSLRKNGVSDSIRKKVGIL